MDRPASITFFEKILSDNQNGSGYITRKITENFHQWFEAESFISKTDIQNIIVEIFQTFPNFAVLFHFLNQLALFTESFSVPEIQSIQFLQFLQKYQAKWEDTTGKTAENFINEIDLTNKNILLHSNSSAIQSVFKAAEKKRISCTVWQTVSSPANEGIKQAKALANMDFTVNLIHEDEIWLFKNKFDLIMLGADLITPGFFINKTGSYSIVLLNKPVFLLAESRKLINTQKINNKLFHLLTEEKEKNPGELLPETNHKIRVLNYYFERVPLQFITGIFLETGLRKPPELFLNQGEKDFSISKLFTNF